jgi:hypothetical protein
MADMENAPVVDEVQQEEQAQETVATPAEHQECDG